MQPKATPIDLENPSQAGVYLVSDEDLDAILATEHAQSTRLLRVDLGPCAGKHALFEILAKVLGLHPDTVRNWDALAAALEDLSAIPAQGYIMLISSAQGLRTARPADFETLLDILDEAAAGWSAADIPFFAFVALPEADQAATGQQAEEFRLRDDYVELNQLLKLTGICDSGGAGKALVASGAVLVDGQVELRKTCKIRADQVVHAGGRSIRVLAARAD
jgi:ribosome-associated protein YbcJ (S4-like RNA binding protein)